MKPFVVLLLAFLAPCCGYPKPNIIVVLADDLGYGDVRCNDPEHAKVPTPNIDRLAEQGMRFTDAHTSASLCSPSRYSLLTGRFSWRTPMRTHVVRVYGTPLIAPDRLTLPKLLQQQGYHTGCFGKWHLGWDWALRQKDDSVVRALSGDFLQERKGEPIFDQPIGQGPTTRGFNYYFGVDVPNFPPYTFIENDRMVTAPTARKTVNDRVHWGPPGPMAPDWQFDRILPTIVEKTEDYIAQRARDKKPFFIYMPLTTPHEPIAPSEAFRGKSGISDVADLIMETDDALGRVMTALQKHELADNTLLVFTSDNGHCSYTGLTPFQEVGHRVGGPYRGYKCNISEGGHRVPFVVRWPDVVKPGTRCDQLVCLSDLMATCAEMLGTKLPDNAAEDSVSLLPLLRGKDRPVRRDLVHQCYSEVLAIREGPWKLALCAGDGTERRWCNEKGVPQDTSEKEARERGLPPVQLYNVADDPGETKNLQAEHPETVQRLRAQLEKYVFEGRSTPGTPQKNDLEISFPRPQLNVILFLADDLGYGDLGCHGNRYVKTPHLDTFARAAVEFTKFHVSPVCSPTRASLMTGRYNFRTGVCDVFGKATVMDSSEVTIAERLKAAGYATGIFGKWHLGDDAEHGPNAQGFDEALVHRGAAMRKYFDPELLHNGTPEKRTGYCMDIFTDAAIEFIKKNRAKPFFVYLPANLIHTPLQPVPELAAEFDALGLSDSTQKIYGMIRSVDNNFGKLRVILKQLELEDNTLLIFTSDNGPCSGSKPVDRHMAGLHGLKGTVYENGIRVPCFMRWPVGFKSPAKVTRLAAHIDVMPTVLEACGLPAAPKLDGVSLLPLLRDPSAQWPDRTLFLQWDSGQQPQRGHAFTVLTEKWKLVQPCGMNATNQQHIRDRYAELCRLQGRGERSIEGPPRYELYDIAADPGETKDLASQHPDIVKRMKQDYEKWFTEVCARWNP
jgi:arylsulfatase A-like enzyme